MGTLCRSSVILNGEARHPYANSAFPYDVLRLHASPSVNYIIAHIPQNDNTFCKNFTFLFEHRCEKAYFVENTPFEIVLLWTILIIFDYLRLFLPRFASRRRINSLDSTPLFVVTPPPNPSLWERLSQAVAPRRAFRILTLPNLTALRF